MLKNTLTVTFMLGLVLAGCGSNSDSSGKDAGASNAGTGANAGTTGGTGGASGSTSTGNAGNGADGGMQQLACDTSVTSATTCGSNACTPIMGAATMVCTVNCCVNDKCGTRRAVAGGGQGNSQCKLPIEIDTRCPKQTLMGQMVDGCCTADNHCGIADNFLTNSCVANKDVPAFIGGPFPTKTCDGTGDDAGTN